MKPTAPEERVKHVFAVGREYLTHWAIAGAFIALTGFAPEHWVADLFGHLSISENLRAAWMTRAFDLRIGLVAAGVAIVAWDVLRRSKLQRQLALQGSTNFGHTTNRSAGDRQASDTATLGLANKPSIAVLPFQNMSGDPEQEYFADGMVEEIITGLSRIKWLLVISRNSSFIYKDKPISVNEVADKLGVRYLLEGSVRKSGSRVRITAQLIDTQTGAHLWAEQYDRLLEDVFAMQDEITMCVIGAIEPNLRKAEIDRVKRQRPSNFNAYDLVLRSLPFVYAQMPKEAALAIPLLENALKLEPNYSVAHAFLSWCFHARYSRGSLSEEDCIAAIHHAHAASAHGNDDAMSLAAAAFVIAMDEHDTVTALKIFDRALELSSSNVFALSGSAIVFAWMGKAELAIERAKRALQLSPFDPLNFWSNHALAITYFHTQRYGESVDAARSAIDSNPGFSIPRAILAGALLRLGRVAEARAVAQTVMECQPSFTIHGISHVCELERAVFRPIADAWREVGLPE